MKEASPSNADGFFLLLSPLSPRSPLPRATPPSLALTHQHNCTPSSIDQHWHPFIPLVPPHYYAMCFVYSGYYFHMLRTQRIRDGADWHRTFLALRRSPALPPLCCSRSLYSLSLSLPDVLSLTPSHSHSHPLSAPFTELTRDIQNESPRHRTTACRSLASALLGVPPLHRARHCCSPSQGCCGEGTSSGAEERASNKEAKARWRCPSIFDRGSRRHSMQRWCCWEIRVRVQWRGSWPMNA